MRLFARSLGQGQPLLLLHGLLGSGDNLLPLAQRLADTALISLPDLPGHGRSPHARDLSLENMARELLAHADALGWQRFGVLGHSLGGRLAMQMALTQPQRIMRILVADMAPREYPVLYPRVFEALGQIKLNEFQDRLGVDLALSEKITDSALRAFLLKSLARSDDGSLAWRFDVEGLDAARPSYRRALQGRFDGPALFIHGTESDYLRPQDHALILELFPHSETHSLENAGHWLHVDSFEAFTSLTQTFFSPGSRLPQP